MKLQVGVKALIKNPEGYYLLLKRAMPMENETQAHWDIPGGRINPDEVLLDGLMREIDEETGVLITSGFKLIGAQDIFVPSKELHVVRLTYAVDGNGEVIVSHEHQETRWVSIYEALTLNLDPYLRDILREQENT